MATITEDYVSFETAKLLKEKGFDTPVWTRYENDDDNDVIFGDKYNWNNSPMGQISAPTLQMAMKWLREAYNIHIAIGRGPKGYHITIETIPLGVVKYITREIVGTTYVGSYEYACEASIKFCLEKFDLREL